MCPTLRSCRATMLLIPDSTGFSGKISSKRPTGGLGLLLDVYHDLAVASWTPQRGHAAGIFSAEFGCTDCHINDGFIDQHLFTAHRAAIAIFLRRRAERFVQGFRWERLVALATYTFLSLLPRAHRR